MSVIDQDTHRAKISPFCLNKPENFWISKNIDFLEWDSANDSRTLLLLAPPGHGTTEVCSHVIDLAERASQTNSSLLYFFAISTDKARSSTNFTHTLLHQLVCCSTGNADFIAATFLDTLLGGHFKRLSRDFNNNDTQDMAISKILCAPDNELIEALVEAIKTTGTQQLSIICDGLWDIAYPLVNQVMEATPRLKALVTSRQKAREIPKEMFCIEYDKERQGLQSAAIR